MSRPINVMVALKPTLLRESIKMALETNEDISVIGEALSLSTAIELTKEVQPGILLLSLEFLNTDSCEDIQNCLCSLNEVSPACKILIIVTKEIDYSKLVCAVRSGAKGYVSIQKGVDHLVKSIQQVNQGEIWVERKLIPRLINQEESNDKVEDPGVKAKEIGLTRREKEVLDCLAEGLCNKEIADKLFISQKTVKTHLTNIFRKLNVADRLQAVLCAIEKGLE